MATYTPGYKQVTVSINSSSVPVSIVAPGFMSRGWNVRVRTGAAASILLFSYRGALPGAAPANVREVAPGENYGDTISSAFSGADDGIGDGLAAVLETGTTAVTVDLWYS